jgi:uncharacterized caspase-like protein
MRKKACIFWLVVLTVLIPLCLSAATRGLRVTTKQGKTIYLYNDYYALVVGVSNYDQWPDIRGAGKDASSVADILERAGMQVNLLLDPTSDELKGALNKLTYGAGSEKDRAILFYYSGHGETETLATGEKLGYIVPRDCPLSAKDKSGFVDKAISMYTIETYALRMQSRHVLMVFDSCFSGSVFASLKGVPMDISEKSSLPVRQFITAGNETEQVPDNSVFKTCFVQGITGEADANKDGYVTASELGLYLDSSVVNYSHGSQHPQYGKIRHPTLDKGDFIFLMASSAATLEKPSVSEGISMITVEVSVSGAKVMLDSKHVGTTPLSPIAVLPGEHEVRVEKPGYEPYFKRFSIDASRSMTLSVYPKTIAAETVRLFVEVEPKGAEIRLLNIAEAFRQGMDLQPGQYQVEVSANGYATKMFAVDMRIGQDQYVSVRLDRMKGPGFTNSIGMKFVYCPPGTFTMGSPSSEQGSYGYYDTQHQVIIS